MIDIKQKIIISIFIFFFLIITLNDYIKKSYNTTIILRNNIKINIIYSIILTFCIYLMYDYCNLSNYINTNVIHKMDIYTDPIDFYN